jgi:NAD(P)-dependent dehydrogenase (short-subunit alcohol dehydrogenase family)
MSTDLDGSVALITGGAHGIGEGVARRLGSHGVKVVIADVDDVAGRALAGSIGGHYVHCDVGDFEQCRRAVDEAVRHFGGLDIAHLNAGITSGCSIGEDFDLARYRRAMAINLDGVVFGVQAALPALQARGGGRIVCTASLAGLVAVPGEPFYAANKHAVVGLVRSLGPTLAAQSIVINALCPAFADTAIIDNIRELLSSLQVSLIPVEAVVDAFMAILASEESGQCWYVQPGRPSAPFAFRGAPGPRTEAPA